VYVVIEKKTRKAAGESLCYVHVRKRKRRKYTEVGNVRTFTQALYVPDFK